MTAKLTTKIMKVSTPRKLPAIRYLPRLLMSAFVETPYVHYFCLGEAPEPVGSRNFEREEQGLAIDDSVDIGESSSLFEVGDGYF